MSVEHLQHPRIRYGISEIKKLAMALERADPTRTELGVRTLELEDMLEDARALAARWRQSAEVLHEVLTCMGPEPNLERLYEILRTWSVTGE